MASSTRDFRELVDQAFAGRLKLPAFQRSWRWRTEKVKKLFDSLRQRYPIGTLLFLGGDRADLSPRAFDGANKQKIAQTENLVLDGQQRLTAGIHLFYGTGKRQYFIDLQKLSALASEQGINLKDRDATGKFAASIDTEDEYLVARAAVDDPRSFLIEKHLLCTSILGDGSALSQAGIDYVAKYPERQDLFYFLVVPHFSMSKLDHVPYVTIDAGTQLDAISRIFTTLNTTGQLLTPFELVVAILYPQKIDLVKEYKDLCQLGQYFQNMDATGEILLQTIAMLAGLDPKKANLPRTITPAIWHQHHVAAFEALEALGEFLTLELGAALNVKGASLVPYDAIYAPMACAYRIFQNKNLKGNDLSNARVKFRRWYAGSALSQRYQEGVHNKQRRDYDGFVQWLENDEATPAWLNDVRIVPLARASFGGAIGKLVQGLINLRNTRDPLQGTSVGFKPGASDTERHHLFPTKYLIGLAGWNKKQDSGDVIGNLMFVERDTNRKWINFNPVDQLADARNTHSDQVLREWYNEQLIDGDAYALLSKPDKTKADFFAFISIRQATIRKYLADHYGFPLSDAPLEEDLDEEEMPGDADALPGAVAPNGAPVSS